MWKADDDVTGEKKRPMLQVRSVTLWTSKKVNNDSQEPHPYELSEFNEVYISIALKRPMSFITSIMSLIS